MRLLDWSAVALSCSLACEVALSDSTAPCSDETKQFVVEVTNPKGDPVSFKGAVGYGGQLQLVEGVTPYRMEISASKLLAMFKSDVQAPLTAALYMRVGENTELIGNITDVSPAIYESVSCRYPLIRTFGRY